MSINDETSSLNKVLIHRPDEGTGKLPPELAKELLFDDTIHHALAQKEYDRFKRVLLYFVDPQKGIALAQKLKAIKSQYPTAKERDIAIKELMTPGSEAFLSSDKVLEFQEVLSEALENENNKIPKTALIASVCAIEACSFKIQEFLMHQVPSGKDLARILITGVIPYDNGFEAFCDELNFEKGREAFVFKPIQNLMLTRDLAVTIDKHLLLGKARHQARSRENLLMSFIARYSTYFHDFKDHIIELWDDTGLYLSPEEDKQAKTVSIECGDIMMIEEGHVVLGISQRTSEKAVQKIVMEFLTGEHKAAGIETVSVIQQSEKKRSQMHIDTILNRVDQNVWLLSGDYDEEAYLTTFRQKNRALLDSFFDNSPNEDNFQLQYPAVVYRFEASNSGGIKQYRLPGVKSLLASISDPKVLEAIKAREDSHEFDENLKHVIAGCDAEFVYCGGGAMNKVWNEPYVQRERWTDGCNVIALKPGVLLGYERNVKTLEAFRAKGYEVLKAKDFLKHFDEMSETELLETIKTEIAQIQNTIITFPAPELTRARGGPHCMTMPVERGG